MFYFMLVLLLDATGISTWAPLTCEANRAKKKPEKGNKLDSQTECSRQEKHRENRKRKEEKGEGEADGTRQRLKTYVMVVSGTAWKRDDENV